MLPVACQFNQFPANGSWLVPYLCGVLQLDLKGRQPFPFEMLLQGCQPQTYKSHESGPKKIIRLA